MTAGSFRYLVKQGARSIWSNRLMSVASILVLLACLLLIGGSVLFTANVNKVLDFVAARNELSVDLKDNADETVRADIKAQLESMDSVESVKFIPKKEGFEAFLKFSFGDNIPPLMQLQMEDPPVDDSYLVTLRDVEKMREVQRIMEGNGGVSKVISPTDTFEMVAMVRNMVAIAGTIIVAILIIVSLVITANTIKLTVFNRRKEINIMKYVGATDWFIRLPFIIEAILLGLIASILAFLITWGYYSYLLQLISDWIVGDGVLAEMTGTLIPFYSLAPQLFIGFCAGGVLTGMIGSMMFVRRHLKV